MTSRRPTPLYYCPICLAPYEPNGDYLGCPSCVERHKEVIIEVLARAERLNAPYWAHVYAMQEEQRRSHYQGGDIVMMDGTVEHYGTAAERARLERINSVHVGADLGEPPQWGGDKSILDQLR